eukprot:gnl/Trimastix_PCT/3246.p1 GENE.gnl/Trimastix_PCT/3246~~gnl/Trimastix_PCT/3246.p1  ORF type:complete len:1195 (+),score=183.55 gnl/Trimastix_PCT/3246:45-3587(+)
MNSKLRFFGALFLLCFCVTGSATNTLQWTALPPSNADPSERAHHCTVSYNNSMIIFGGQGLSAHLNDLHKYDPVTSTWSALPNNGADTPTARSQPACIVYQDAMFMAGGLDSGGNALNDIWKYDFDTQSWAEWATLPITVSGHSLVVPFTLNVAFLHAGIMSTPPFTDNLGTGATYKLFLENTTSNVQYYETYGPSLRSGHASWATDTAVYLAGGVPINRNMTDPQLLDDGRWKLDLAYWRKRFLFAAPVGARPQVDRPAVAHMGKLGVALFGGFALNKTRPSSAFPMLFSSARSDYTEWMLVESSGAVPPSVGVGAALLRTSALPYHSTPVPLNSTLSGNTDDEYLIAFGGIDASTGLVTNTLRTTRAAFPYPPLCSLQGTPVHRTTAGELSTFTVALKDIFDRMHVLDTSRLAGNVTCKGQSYPIAFVSHINGLYTATYNATTADIDCRLYVTVDGLLLPGTPALLIVDPAPMHPSATVTLPVTFPVTFTAGVTQRYDVKLSDRFGNARMPTAGDYVQGLMQGNETQTVNGTDHKNGTHELNVCPTVTHLHTMDIRVNGTTLPGSPWTFDVLPAQTHGPSCDIYGPAVDTGAIAGVQTFFTVVARDRFKNLREQGGDTFHLYARGPIVDAHWPFYPWTYADLTRAFQATCDDPGTGTYNCSYTHTLAGRYVLEPILINAQGQEERMSADHALPFVIQPAPTNASQCEADGRITSLSYLHSNLVASTANVSSNFSILAYDSFGNFRHVGGNVFTVTLECVSPANGYTTTGTVIDHNTGHYTVTYQANEPGDYQLSVTLDSKHIKNSPWDMTIGRYTWTHFDIPLGNDTVRLGPFARSGHQMVAYNDLLLVYGGSTEYPTALTNDLWSFNPETQQWTEIQQAPACQATQPDGRSGHALLVVQDTLYTFGGERAGKMENLIYQMDLTCLASALNQSENSTCCWTLVSAASPPSNRSWVAAAASESSQALFFHGGLSDTRSQLGDFWKFSTASNTWTALATGPPSRYGHAMAHHAPSNKLYLFGGRNVTHFRGDLWVYDIGGNAWTHIEPLGALPDGGRMFASALFFGDSLMIFSGVYEREVARLCDTSLRYDIRTNSFHQVQLPASAARPAPRWRHATAGWTTASGTPACACDGSAAATCSCKRAYLFGGEGYWTDNALSYPSAENEHGPLYNDMWSLQVL